MAIRHSSLDWALADVRECEKRKVDTLKEEIGRLMEEIEVSMLNNNHVEKCKVTLLDCCVVPVVIVARCLFDCFFLSFFVSYLVL